MIIYHIFEHTKYDNYEGMPMKPEDLDIVYSYCPNTFWYCFKRYGIRRLIKEFCLTERGAERRIKRLNKENLNSETNN